MYLFTQTRFLLLTIICLCGHIAGAQQLIPFLDGKRWGYADTNGKVVLAPKWEYPEFFHNGRAVVRYHDETCIIDSTGKYIIPPWRHWTGKFYSTLKGAEYNARSREGLWGIIDSNGHEVISCLYQRTDGNKHPSMWTGYFAYDHHFNTYTSKAKKNGKIGIIDTLNRVRIPFEYDGVLSSFDADMPDRYYMVWVKGRYGLINTDNKMMIPPRYDNIRFDRVKKQHVLLQFGKRTAVADTMGRIEFADTAYRCDYLRDTLIYVTNKNGSGLMTISHRLLVPCKYARVCDWGDSILVGRDSIDAKGERHYLYCVVDQQTWKEASEWFTQEVMYARRYPPKPEPPAPFKVQMNIRGKKVNIWTYESVEWAAKAVYYAPTPCYIVVGRPAGQDSFIFNAVIDTFGNFLSTPDEGPIRPLPLNTLQGLYYLGSATRASYGDIIDSTRHVLAHNIKQPVAAFYYRDELYYVERTETTVNDYALFPDERKVTFCRLMGSDGKPVPEFERYNLQYNIDSFGYSFLANRYRSGAPSFMPPFSGYFLATDSAGRSGIVHIGEGVIMPRVSFKYSSFEPVGYGIFSASNIVEEKGSRYSWPIANGPEDKYLHMPLKGQPYLVDSNNKVLLDSLSVGACSGERGPGDCPLIDVVLARPDSNDPFDDVNFYMDLKGKGYYRNLPHARLRKRVPDPYPSRY